jgi:hypothetical protein
MMSAIVLYPWSPALGQLEHAWVRLPDHLLAEVHSDEVLLKDVVVEHVLGSFAEVDDPLAEMRRFDAVGHVLRIARARGVVVPADATDPTRDEVGVARVLALHEDGVAAEDRRRRVAFSDGSLLEVDLGVDAETPHDPRDGVPRHFDKLVRAVRRLASRLRHRHVDRPPWL